MRGRAEDGRLRVGEVGLGVGLEVCGGLLLVWIRNCDGSLLSGLESRSEGSRSRLLGSIHFSESKAAMGEGVGAGLSVEKPKLKSSFAKEKRCFDAVAEEWAIVVGFQSQIRDGRRHDSTIVNIKLSIIDKREVNIIIGTLGGILILWKRYEVLFDFIENSSQLVFGNIQISNKGSWNVATVYDDKDLYVRRGLWDMLERLSSSNIPSIMGGDFNCILSKEDKRGIKRFIFSYGPQKIKTFMANNNFYKIYLVQ
ncbi:hypothetical protein M5K25_006928 [Dendrobium thyrsiflorum]|uniref:Endonuclease/exonuclease/phosphatase domain-containing protein n=1 Tax=Dendrobium thyrsiflorum TaxID=117978 RepID=A0ABD0VDY8_DENTH